MSLLHFRVSTDIDFLLSTLDDLAKNDKKIRKMMDFMQQIRAESIRQPLKMLMQQTVNLYFIKIFIYKLGIIWFNINFILYLMYKSEHV